MCVRSPSAASGSSLHFLATERDLLQNIKVARGRFEFKKRTQLSSARTTKHFLSSRCASAIQIIRPQNPRHVVDPVDYSQVYGTRKNFPVYGSFTMDPDAKSVTSTYFPSSRV